MDLLQDLDDQEPNYPSSNSNVNIERRFSCVVCLSPKFKMVYGLCQHRICASCGYWPNGTLKMAFRRCPTCQQENVFPSVQPCIPEDNIASQKILGVRICENKDCGQEIWHWEKSEHELTCRYRNFSPRYRGRHSDIKDKYSSVTPRTPSTRRQARCEDSSETRSSYLLRSKESKRKSNSTPKAVESPTGYNFRHVSKRSGERDSRT